MSEPDTMPAAAAPAALPPRPAGPAPGNPNVIHFLRTVQTHHVALSTMADQKANILIGVNSVIFALVVRDGMALTLPMAILAGSSAVAALLCMLAVVPAFGARPAAASANPNLVFFGHFTGMSEAEFQAAMEATMTTDAGIRAAMTRDIYQLGTVLRRKKYHYLGLAYRVFMAGLAATLVTYAGGELLAQL